MDIWITLGIGETKDKEAIKNAYRMKLTTVNPEDDPDGFMRLREAYEEAVRLAEERETEAAPEAEEALNGVERAIDEIYRHFEKRIDVSCWETLFASDYFTSLEQSSESFEKLLVYVMDHYRLPGKVFRLIVETFDIEERRAELGELFPDDFLSYMISNAKYEDIINYYIFEGDLSCADEFIDTYYALRRFILQKQYGETAGYFEKLESMPVCHPYVAVLKIQMELLATRDKYEEDNIIFRGEDAEKMDAYKSEIAELVKRYPEDNTILDLQGDLELYTGNYDAAKDIFEHILKNDSMSVNAIDKLADLNYRQGNFEASRDMYMELIQLNPYDGHARAGMFRANMAFIEEGKKHIAENPDDHNMKQEMAWSCYQNYMYEDGIAILDTFEPTMEECFKYYNVKGRMYIEAKQYEKALDCFLKWKQAVEILMKTDNPSEEDYGKIKRYPYIKSLIGDCYNNLGNYEEARAILQDALEADYDEKPYTYEILCELLYKMERYDECIRQCDAALTIQPENHMFYMCKAKACFEREYLRESLFACDRAIAIFPYVLEAYVYKIKIYQWVEQYDDAAAVIEQYRQLVPASDTMKYYEALNLKYSGESEKAQKILEELRASYNAEESDLEDYTEALCLLADIYDDYDDYEMRKKAIDVYHEVLAVKPDHPYVHGYLGYMHRMNFEYKSSIEECSKQVEIKPYPNVFLNRALSYKRLNRYTEAIEDLTKVLEMEPDRLFCYNQLGQICYTEKDFEQAIAWYEKGITRADESGEEKIEQKLEMIRWKARALACLSRYEESVELMQTTLDTYGDERDYDIRYELALTYTRLDRFDLARKVLEEYIETGENEDEKFWYMSLLMELTGEEGCLDESRQLYNRAAALKPDNKKIHGLMGRILAMNKCYEEARYAFFHALDEEAQGSYDYACEYLEMVSLCEGTIPEELGAFVQKAKKNVLSIKNPKQYIKLARLYRALREYNTALQWIQDAIDADACLGCGYVGCEEGYYELGITYQRMGDMEKAREAFEKAIEIHGHCGMYDVKLAECSK